MSESVQNGPDFSKSELLPVIAQDDATGDVLMLAYMNQTAWEETLAHRPRVLLQPQPEQVMAKRGGERQRPGGQRHLLRLRCRHALDPREPDRRGGLPRGI